jgi:streptomycin 6-kinase
MADLPVKFTRNVLEACGASGERWLNELPAIIEEIERNWSLKADKPFRNLSYNYVAPCCCADGGAAVLKIALPLNNPEIYNEAEFLQIRNAIGAVKLLKFDENRRAILLEKLKPGENLKEVCRSEKTSAVEIAVSIIHRLLMEPASASEFQTLDNWFENFFKKVVKTDFPLEFQNTTRKFYEKATGDSKRKFLLHGDLHHENILSAEREPFLAIDPKGVVGDVGYEIAVFLNNHLRWLKSENNRLESLNQAVSRFSETFEIEPDDLRKWAYAQMVLSAWWTFEENGIGWEKDLKLAGIWDL